MEIDIDTFNATNYLSTVMWYDNVKSLRKRGRGFTFIETIAADICFNEGNTNDKSIVEFGIGGGGTLIDWAENFHGIVYGLEQYDPTSVPLQTDDEVLQKHIAGRAAAIETLEMFRCKNVVMEYGLSGYDRSSAEYIFNKNNKRKISMVIDDGDTDNGALLGLVPAWKDFIDEECGIIITETPFGNGIEKIYNMPEEEQMQKLKTLSVEQEMVIFDTRQMAMHNNYSPWQVSCPVYYLGVHCANWQYYNILFEKFNEHIIFGKEYLANDET
jgi:hypothetical protein